VISWVEPIKENTKKNSAPRGKFRIVENGGLYLVASIYEFLKILCGTIDLV
jgi:hypothetical protein